MPHLFTVRWPVFARMEVILFFPFALRLASETGPVRVYVDKTIMPALAPVCAPLGLSDNAIFWLAMTAVVAVPYLITLIVADRLMTVRKGYALLSVVAIALWAFALSRLSSSLIGLVPDSMLAGTALLSFDQEIALAAAGVALVPHLWPLWIGLRDDGAIAMRLLDSAYDPAWRSGLAGRGRQNEDLYRRQTAAFREWRNPRQQFEGLGSGPRENSAASVLHLITWVGVILGIGGSYLNWAGVIDLHHQGLKPAPAPGVAAGPLTGGAALKPVTMPPVVQVAPALPMVNSHVVSVMPLPMVQRPTELSSSVQSANAISGPNEAVSERGADGSFAFDAVVNGGVHVRMLFDTGASIVGLRAEDATRIGIPIANLNYSAKIKTANGTADVAPVMIGTMMIGNITLRNVPGFVAKQGMLQENLLGQTFLARLAGFNVEKNLLVLKGR